MDGQPLWATLLRAAQLVESRLETALAATGLSLAKVGVLKQLVQAGEPLPLSRIAERLCCVKSNMTQLVDRLEADGLVKRIDDPDDRRTVLAAITDEGRRRYEAGNLALVEQERALTKTVGREERTQVLKVLIRLGG